MAKKEKKNTPASTPITTETVSIVIPCYNEEESIQHLSQQLLPAVKDLQQKWNVELIFVDDGSKDQTHKLLQDQFGNLPFTKIIQHEHNKNLGAALKTGFHHATGNYVAALDSDCTYSPTLVKTMMNMMDQNTDIVTVSLHHPEAAKLNDAPAYRIFLSRSISQMYRTLLRSKVYSYTAMVRVYRKPVLDSIQFNSNTFLSVTEIMIKALLKGYHVKEHPVPLQKRQFGTSKIKLAGVIKDHLGLIKNIVLYKTLRREF